MKLKVKLFDIEAGGNFIVALPPKVAADFDLTIGGRVRLLAANKYHVCVANITSTLQPNEIGVFKEVSEFLDLKDGELVTVQREERPSSILAIRKKLDKGILTKDEVYDIITDIVDNRLTQAEMAYFIASAYLTGFTMSETEYVTMAMAETGDMLRWDVPYVVDKHSIGGIAGNRTTMLIVPIVTSTGLVMPKTSSRSITSPAGTADTMEVLAKVGFKLHEIKSIVNRANGCIIWGGALKLAPADDNIIKVEHPLGLDPTPMLLSSIMAKKFVAGAKYVLVDIPVGKYSKVKTEARYKELSKKFVDLGKRLGMVVKVYKSQGLVPVGKGFGPALEARDILWVLQRDKRAPKDLEDKAVEMAGIILEMAKKAPKGKGSAMARRILNSGKAWEQMKRIISAQKGDPKVTGDKLKLGSIRHIVFAQRSGVVKDINDDVITKIARLAGAPENKGAGIYLKVSLGDKIKARTELFEIYAESEFKMREAIQYMNTVTAIKIK